MNENIKVEINYRCIDIQEVIPGIRAEILEVDANAIERALGQNEDKGPPAPTQAEVRTLLNELCNWAGYMGGWDAPVWGRLRNMRDRIPVLGEPMSPFLTLRLHDDEVTCPACLAIMVLTPRDGGHDFEVKCDCGVTLNITCQWEPCMGATIKEASP